ncbi:FtsQ-type POTRA domain-containing protein [Microbacterium sp. WCS2018Hpa-23]|uniref:FtsQ-type POTRA domain-containing protein n=1 Tax=Microbacterium sp. WCS2018Hpa-23 TaxID=3073634 RepID=UPI0028833BEB|nr:FtsQ-type POTRA domain-containing protein [Microbacterium sp. WCS2018Hpa-23]
MRRPPPLPTPPAGLAEDESAAGRRAGSRGRTRPAAGDGRRDDADVVDLGAYAGDAGAEDAERPTSTRDVWRAARARRKALRAEIRRFTQRSRRRRIIWLSAIGAVVLLVGGTITAAYSPLFAVERITVVGATTLDPAAVEAALAAQIGTPLASIDSSEVKASLLAFPLIETYALEAKPPHDLTVRIVERTPVGVIRSDAGYTLVDAAGVALATTSDQPAGQPLLDIEGGTDSAAFESAGLVVRSVPADLRATLTGVRATSPDDVTLTLRSGLTVVWGSSEDSPMKSEALSKTLIGRPDASTIDVTSPHAVVVG